MRTMTISSFQESLAKNCAILDRPAKYATEGKNKLRVKIDRRVGKMMRTKRSTAIAMRVNVEKQSDVPWKYDVE